MQCNLQDARLHRSKSGVKPWIEKLICLGFLKCCSFSLFSSSLVVHNVVNEGVYFSDIFVVLVCFCAADNDKLEAGKKKRFSGMYATWLWRSPNKFSC